MTGNELFKKRGYTPMSKTNKGHHFDLAVSVPEKKTSGF